MRVRAIERGRVSAPCSKFTGRLRDPARQGMTLLEVLLALAIFLFSLVAISQLFNLATDQAAQVQLESRATRLAQSKLAEYTAGVISLSTGGNNSGTFEDDMEPDWSWQATVQPDGSAQGLYLVSITVSRDSPSQGHFETSLTQYVLDPTIKGNIPNPTTIVPSTTTTESSSSTTTTGTTAGSTTSSMGGSTTGTSAGGSGTATKTGGK